MIGFTCENLTPDQAATVYPLLREAIPGLTLEAWLRHAKRLASPSRASQSGIMAVRREPRRLPCGLFVYHRTDDLEHGAVLVAEHMVAIDLLDPEPVMQVLVHELEQLAGRLGCGGIRTMVIGKDAPITHRLLAAGHASTGSSLFKPMPNDTPAPSRPRRPRPAS